MQIETPEPGWQATIYAAPPGAVPKSIDDGWTKVGGGTVNSEDKRFKLDTGGERLPLLPGLDHRSSPPDAERAEISEIRLLQKVAALA